MLSPFYSELLAKILCQQNQRQADHLSVSSGQCRPAFHPPPPYESEPRKVRILSAQERAGRTWHQKKQTEQKQYTPQLCPYYRYIKEG